MNKIGVSMAVAIMVFVVSATMAYSEEPQIRFKPWAQIFANYSYNFSDYPDWDTRHQNNDYNGTEFTQTWIGLDAFLSDKSSVRVVLDSKRAEATKLVTTTREIPDPNDETQTISVVDSAQLQQNRTGRFDVWLTYAYFRHQFSPYFALDLGIVSGAMSKQHNNYWRYRYVDHMGLYKYGFAQYGDLGIGMDGVFPAGFGGWRVDVVNGEGKATKETDSGKAIEAQAHFNPFPKVSALSGLHLAGFYKLNRVSNHKPRESNTVWDAILSYQYAGDAEKTWGFSVNGEYGQSTRTFGAEEESPTDPQIDEYTSTLLSVWADVYAFTRYGLVARYDSFDPNTENDESTGLGYQDETELMIAGVWFEPIKYLRLCPNFRQTSYTAKVIDDEGEEADMDPDRMFYFSAEFKY